MENIQNKYSAPIPLNHIRVTDDFWKHEMELVRTEVIPYQWEALNDRVPGASPSFCMRNFRVAGKLNRLRREQGENYEEKTYPVDFGGGLPEVLPESMDRMEDRFYGFVFQDSDFAKWIEAVGYSLTQHPDEKLEAVADAAIDVVCEAQQEDGYLDTFYIINDRSKIFTNLKDNHELYCFGHLTEGAVAYYQATGKDKLLNAVCRYADFIAENFGPEKGKCKGYPGHEIAEMALVRLYETTGNEKYLALSQFFTDMRGTRPYYFDFEHQVRQGDGLRYEYHQAHLPVREQKEAVGHAVRAVYLYSGMADLARLTGDKKLLEACEALWDDITMRKMYITGGIGGTHIGEAFSFAYDLPNDTAYAETCASIGLVFFARRMLQIKADSKYADVMERALYNGILSGMALDGKSFFYVNPLESFPEACHKDERKFHVKPVRQKWFGCACCPPNIARLLSSIGSYAYTETDDTLYVHLYLGGRITKYIGTRQPETKSKNAGTDECAESKNVVKEGQMESAGAAGLAESKHAAREESADSRAKEKTGLKHAAQTESGKDRTEENTAGEKAAITIISGLPWDGDVLVKVDTESEKPLTIAFRIPDWAGNYTAEGLEGAQTELRDGYLYVTRQWNKYGSIALHFPMEVHVMQPNSMIREDAGKAALMRGPIVYCMEEADNGKNLHLTLISAGAQIEELRDDRFGQTAVRLIVPGKRLSEKEGPDQSLYHVWKELQYKDVKLQFIPYYMWANRGEGEMQVWVRCN